MTHSRNLQRSYEYYQNEHDLINIVPSTRELELKANIEMMNKAVVQLKTTTPYTASF